MNLTNKSNIYIYSRTTSINITTQIENPWKKPDAKDDCCLM